MRLDLTLLGRRGHRSDCDDTVDHAIFLKGSIVLCSILKGEKTVTLFEILEPVALVLASV